MLTHANAIDLLVPLAQEEGRRRYLGPHNPGKRFHATRHLPLPNG